MDGIIFYHDRIVIPAVERSLVLKDVHNGHQGESKCLRRAREVVWWPGMTNEIREMVQNCKVCEQHRLQPKEPLLATPLPERPWWRLATDLFEFNSKHYLLVVDYFSRYIAVQELKDSTDSVSVVKELENLFCMLGVPDSIFSDNGPQFISSVFKDFVRKWGVTHLTSSPRYPQSNGEAERAVRTVKGLMDKNMNLQAALCAYRDTPLANGYSPAQLLFNRSLNLMGLMVSKSVDIKRLQQAEFKQREVQTRNFNRRYGALTRNPLEIGQSVVIREPGKPQVHGEVVGLAGREVVVSSPRNRLFRRNRSQIAGCPDLVEDRPAQGSSAMFTNTETALTKKTNDKPSPINTAESPKVIPSDPQIPKIPARNPVLPHTPGSAKIVRTQGGRLSRAPDRLDL